MAIGRRTPWVALGGRSRPWEARAHWGWDCDVMLCEGIVLPREIKTARLYRCGGPVRTIWRGGVAMALLVKEIDTQGDCDRACRGWFGRGGFAGVAA